MANLQHNLFGVPQTEKTSDDYYTPKWVFDTMGIDFDLDVGSPPEGLPWIPAKRFFTKEDDGLAQEWEGIVWMNPPYSEATAWVNKFIEHRNGSGSIMLPVWFAAFGDECVEAISKLGVCRTIKDS